MAVALCALNVSNYSHICTERGAVPSMDNHECRHKAPSLPTPAVLPQFSALTKSPGDSYDSLGMTEMSGLVFSRSEDQEGNITLDSLVLKQTHWLGSQEQPSSLERLHPFALESPLTPILIGHTPRRKTTYGNTGGRHTAGKDTQTCSTGHKR